MIIIKISTTYFFFYWYAFMYHFNSTIILLLILYAYSNLNLRLRHYKPLTHLAFTTRLALVAFSTTHVMNSCVCIYVCVCICVCISIYNFFPTIFHSIFWGLQNTKSYGKVVFINKLYSKSHFLIGIKLMISLFLFSFFNPIIYLIFKIKKFL